MPAWRTIRSAGSSVSYGLSVTADIVASIPVCRGEGGLSPVSRQRLSHDLSIRSSVNKKASHKLLKNIRQSRKEHRFDLRSSHRAACELKQRTINRIKEARTNDQPATCLICRALNRPQIMRSVAFQTTTSRDMFAVDGANLDLADRRPLYSLISGDHATRLKWRIISLEINNSKQCLAPATRFGRYILNRSQDVMRWTWGSTSAR